MSHRKILINISPPKCGTTSLYHALAKSNHTNSPMIKEPRFFAREESDIYKKIPASLRVRGEYLNGIDWFFLLFADANPDGLYLDFTTYYSITKETPELLKLNFSDVKCIMLLREPVARFVSQYWQYKKMGVNLPSIEKIIHGDDDLS
ncbi:MAG: sulfotransferase domain-containing protein, partial [Oceanospirillaceae bacterium]